MKKPNLFIVGAPKCGTTSMHNYLGQHPDIFMSKAKEPHFFGGHRNSYPKRSWDEYFELFKEANNQKYAGESSTSYLYLEDVSDFIYRYDSGAKIIIMLRNPVNMVYAWHDELLWQCVEDEKDFRAALALEFERVKGNSMPRTKKIEPRDHRVLYRYCGSYYKHVKRYQDTFGKDSVHIIIFEDFVKNTESVYKKCLDFLKVDTSFTPQFKISNPNRYPYLWSVRKWIKTSDSFAKKLILRFVPQKARRFMSGLTYYEKPRPPLPEDLRVELTNYFHDDIVKLEQLLGIDLSSWKTAAAKKID